MTLKWEVSALETLLKVLIFELNVEHTTPIELEGLNKDAKDLRYFLENSYMNIEMCFQDNAPKQLAHTSFSTPPYDAIVLEVIDLIY